MAYINMVDINGKRYNLEALTDGEFEVFLPVLTANDEFILKSSVINNLTSYETKKPLSGYQGRVLSTKITDLTNDMNTKFDDLENYVNEQDTALSDSIKAETDRATAAEKVLTDNLNQEIQDRVDDVDAEETRALAAEKVLTDNLAAEVTRATNAETTLTNNLNAEIQNRTDDVDAEEQRAIAKENEINDALIAEVNRATAAENTLTTNLNAEIDRAKTAEAANATAIETEQARAEGVESDHESRIATMETFFKEADIDTSQEFIDTLKEIQTYIADDKTGAAAMTASIQANATAIETLEEKHNTEMATKVDKVDGSRLMTTAEGNKLAGIAENANNYSHPTHTAYTSGLYKVNVDELGHVTEVTAATKEDITSLGIPAQDTTYVVATATTVGEDGIEVAGVDGLLSSTDKSIYDGYASLITALQDKINELEVRIATLEGSNVTDA